MLALRCGISLGAVLLGAAVVLLGVRHALLPSGAGGRSVVITCAPDEAGLTWGWPTGGGCLSCASMHRAPVPLSILDLAVIGPGQTARDAFTSSVAVAQRAEELGYRRIWYAEHHNMASIASSATSVLVGHIANHTRTIRLGAGGIMLTTRTQVDGDPDRTSHERRWR